MVVSLQHCLLSRIWARATSSDSAISACRNLRLPYRLTHWNVDFMGLLKIQIYLMLSAEAHANIVMTSLSFRPSIRRCTCGLYLEVFYGTMSRIPCPKKSLPSLHEHDGNEILLYRAWSGRFRNL
jgi:hypothetical protein